MTLQHAMTVLAAALALTGTVAWAEPVTDDQLVVNGEEDLAVLES